MENRLLTGGFTYACKCRHHECHVVHSYIWETERYCSVVQMNDNVFIGWIIPNMFIWAFSTNLTFHKRLLYYYYLLSTFWNLLSTFWNMQNYLSPLLSSVRYALILLHIWPLPVIYSIIHPLDYQNCIFPHLP